jgi:hypothetical protein
MGSVTYSQPTGNMSQTDMEHIVNEISEIPPMSMYEYIGILVDKYSNDAELGQYVRELFSQLRTS